MAEEIHVFLVMGMDINRTARLHVICSTREIAESYRAGIAKSQDRSTRLWIEEVMVDHLLGASMGIYTLPKPEAILRGQREGD